MANLPPSLPIASSDSRSSTTCLVQPKEAVEDGPIEDMGVHYVSEKKLETELPPVTRMNDVILPPVGILPHFENFNGSERNRKFEKYEADYADYLMSKHFSNKDVYGGDMFEGTTMIGAETIQSSRHHPMETYLNPGLAFEEESSGSSFLTTVTGEDVSSAQIAAKKGD